MIKRSLLSFNPRGMVVRVYWGKHWTLQPTKYISWWPHGFREEIFLSFPHDKSMGAKDHWVWPLGIATYEIYKLCAS